MDENPAVAPILVDTGNNSWTDADVTAQPPPGQIEPNLRRLRLFLAVVECGSTYRAASKLHLTQSSLTRAVLELEREGNVALFERTRSGMVPNAFGTILAGRARRALSYLEGAERELLEVRGEPGGEAACRGLGVKVTHRQLAAIVGIADYRTETGAAQHLAISQPAITQALRDLERLVGKPLFLRTARSMVPTVSGEILVRRAKLAFSEIAGATNDMASHLGLITGRVVVGLLPMSGALLAPRAINMLLDEHPDLQVSVIEGTLRSLVQEVRCGNIDVIVGALVNLPSTGDIAKEHLFEDVLSIVVRKNHPLTAKKRLSLADLSDARWVVPRRGTPPRTYLDRVIEAAGLDLGSNPIESNGLTTIRALLLESDRLSIISRHQIHFEQSADMLSILPIDLHGTSVSIGVGTRADGLPSAGLQAFLRCLHQVSAELVKSKH